MFTTKILTTYSKKEFLSPLFTHSPPPNKKGTGTYRIPHFSARGSFLFIIWRNRLYIATHPPPSPQYFFGKVAVPFPSIRPGRVIWNRDAPDSQMVCVFWAIRWPDNGLSGNLIPDIPQKCLDLHDPNPVECIKDWMRNILKKRDWKSNQPFKWY